MHMCRSCDEKATVCFQEQERGMRCDGAHAQLKSYTKFELQRHGKDDPNMQGKMLIEMCSDTCLNTEECSHWFFEKGECVLYRGNCTERIGMDGILFKKVACGGYYLGPMTEANSLHTHGVRQCRFCKWGEFANPDSGECGTRGRCTCEKGKAPVSGGPTGTCQAVNEHDVQHCLECNLFRYLSTKKYEEFGDFTWENRITLKGGDECEFDAGLVIGLVCVAFFLFVAIMIGSATASRPQDEPATLDVIPISEETEERRKERLRQQEGSGRWRLYSAEEKEKYRFEGSLLFDRGG